MAERKITMPIALKKNDNQYNPGYGMYYPEIVSTEALSLRGLCERVAFSQSVYSRDIVEGVVTKLRDAPADPRAYGYLASAEPVTGFDHIGNTHSAGNHQLPRVLKRESGRS